MPSSDMLRTSSFDFEAQFHHAQEGYSDAPLPIDADSHMDRRLHRKIAVCQKRFHRYRSRTPPPQSRHTSNAARNHAPTARKPLIKNIPRALKTFISRSPVAQPQNVPLRLNRLHGADHSRMSVLSPSLRKEFRKISYQNPQSSRVVVNLQSSPSPHSQKTDLRSQRVLHQQPQPHPQPQMHSQTRSKSQAPPQPQPHPPPQPKSLRLASKNHHDTVPTQILPSRDTPPSRLNEIVSLNQNNQCEVTEPQNPPSDPSHTQPEQTHSVSLLEEQPVSEPQSDSLAKPTELPLNISNLINKYDKDNSTPDKSNSKIERLSFIPEAQHKFATMRALFEDGPTEHKRATLKSPPRSHTTPVLKSKPYNAPPQSGSERTSISPLSRTTPPITASRNKPDQFLKRHGTRFVKAVDSPASPLDRKSIAAEGSMISSVTKTPDDDTVLGDVEFEEERIDSNRASQVQATDKRGSPERMNLRDLFDSLEVSPDENEKPNAKSSKTSRAREPSSTVAKLIARYGGTDLVTEEANEHTPDIDEPRKEKQRAVEKVDRSFVIGEEDEIQKVYKIEPKDKKKAGTPVDQIPERKGGVEAIPWEARIKSFNVEVEEAASMAYIRKVMSHDGDNDRFKSFSVYSGTEQDSKKRTRSETSGRRWRKRSARAQNKSWLSRKAHEQVHKVKRHVGAMKNIVSADDY